MGFDLDKPEDRSSLITWFFSSIDSSYDHREVIVLGDVDYMWMSNWAKRGYCPPLKIPDQGLVYTGKKLVTIAMAARLVEQGLTPSASFDLANFACEFMLKKYEAPAPNEPTGMPDFRDFVAVVQLSPERLSGPRRAAWINVGPPAEVFAHLPLSTLAYSVLPIGRIWFAIAERAHLMKQEQAETARKSNNPEYDPWIQGQRKRKRVAGSARG
jgi:hypothetical protein